MYLYSILSDYRWEIQEEFMRRRASMKKAKAAPKPTEPITFNSLRAKVIKKYEDIINYDVEIVIGYFKGDKILATTMSMDDSTCDLNQIKNEASNALSFINDDNDDEDDNEESLEIDEDNSCFAEHDFQ